MVILLDHILDKVDFQSEQFNNFSMGLDGGYYLGGYSWIKDNNRVETGW
ncbi:MAG: hypothetical protein IPP06_06640 [Saprospiraceae bacterium]|nr:hypothetical protein [Candidatus Vicinibacter affinis]